MGEGLAPGSGLVPVELGPLQGEKEDFQHGIVVGEDASSKPRAFTEEHAADRRASLRLLR
jgi:hypothetical protein